MSKINFTLLLFFTLQIGLGQQPRQFNYRHFNTQKGLPSNQINDLLQDKKGFIWMATPHGLVRYDGIRYKIFKHRDDDPASLPSNQISSLNLTDKKQRLWLLTSKNEVGFFDTETLKFHPARLPVETPASPNANNFLKTDEFGNVFLVWNEREIFVLDDSKNEFENADHFFPKKKDWLLTDFVQQPGTQKYFAAVRGLGLAVFDRTTGKLSFSEQNSGNEAVVDASAKFGNLFHLLFDSRNRLWFCHYSEELCRVSVFDFAKNRLLHENIFTKNAPTARRDDQLFEQSDSTIWIFGRSTFGYFLEKEGRFALIPPDSERVYDIQYRYLTALLEDRDRNIWAATVANGVFRFNPSMEYFSAKIYQTRDTKKNRGYTPLSLVLDADSSILLSVWVDGLYRFDKNWEQVPVKIKGLGNGSQHVFYDMAKSPDARRIWMGGKSSLVRYDLVSRSAVAMGAVFFKNKLVREVAEDSSGKLWLGIEEQGLFVWDAKKGAADFEKGMKKVAGVGENGLINSISADSKGWIWVGLLQGGVFVLDAMTEQVLFHFGEKMDESRQLPASRCASILEYDDSTVVVAMNASVHLFDRRSRQLRTLRKDGELRGEINSIQRDQAGNIWFGTTSNLYRIHPKNKMTMSFDRYDGLDSDYFTTCDALRLPDGRLLFASASSLIFFDPAAVKSAASLPEIHLTDFKVNDRSWPVDSLQKMRRIDLPADENSLRIEFSPLSFAGLHAVQYKMEGLDKDWVADEEGDRRAIYSYLPPGEYRFLCRVFDTDMDVSDEQVLFSVKIRPHFWQTWQFVGLLILLAGGLFFWFDRERMRRREGIVEVRNKIAADLHSEVSTALQNINILSEMANLKADSDPEKSKEFIEQIQKRSRSVIDSMDDMLWSISPDNDSMTKIAERMQEFVQGLNARHDSRIELQIEDSVKVLNLDMKIRYEAFLLFKEAAQGLLAVSPDGFKLNIGFARSLLFCTIRGGLQGLNKTYLYNFLQRQDLVRRIDALGASMDFLEEGGGFMFELRIPVG